MQNAQTAVRVVVLVWLVSFLEATSPRDRHGRGPLARFADSVRDRMLDAVDPDEIADRLEINALADRLNVNALLDRVDVNALLDRVDVNRLLDGVDVNALLDRVDVNRLFDRVDVEQIMQRARIPELVARSTGNVAESAFNMLRRQLLALDVVLTRSVMRVLNRDVASLPAGPVRLAGDGGPTHSIPAPNAPMTDVTGHYAGPATRLIAHLIDSAVAGIAFTVTSGALLSALRTVGVPVDEVNRTGVVFLSTLAVWVFAYWWASTAVAGRTPGMALVGLRVVRRTGEPLSGSRALVRVLVLPFSLLLMGMGVIGLVLDRERRTLHDLLAGSTVVYDWGDRRATMPTPLAHWLALHAAPIDP